LSRNAPSRRNCLPACAPIHTIEYTRLKK
jgi:hypothetical protein